VQLAASCQYNMHAALVKQRCTATPSDRPVSTLLDPTVPDLCKACMVEPSCRQPQHCALSSITLHKVNPGGEGAVERAADEARDYLRFLHRSHLTAAAIQLQC
jgi:hypothetical protein